MKKYFSIKNRSFFQIFLILLGGGLSYFTTAVLLLTPDRADMGLFFALLISLAILRKGFAPRKEEEEKIDPDLYDDILDV